MDKTKWDIDETNDTVTRHNWTWASQSEIWAKQNGTSTTTPRRTQGAHTTVRTEWDEDVQHVSKWTTLNKTLSVSAQAIEKHIARFISTTMTTMMSEWGNVHRSLFHVQPSSSSASASSLTSSRAFPLWTFLFFEPQPAAAFMSLPKSASSVTRLGDLLDFGHLFKAFGSN